MTIQAYLKKQEKSQINNLTYHLLVKNKQTQSQHKEGNNKIREEINRDKEIEKINEIKSWFSEMIKKKKLCV